MRPVQEVMENALDEFFSGQAALDGKCLVDYVEFDTHYEVAFEDRPVSEAKAVIQPRGMTALLDAIGRGSVALGDKLSALPEPHRPGKVLVVVVTDGMENASREWTADKVKELVSDQQDTWNWDYVFLGANIDAVETGNQYGFKADKSLTFNIHDSEAVMGTSQVLSAYATNYRSAGVATFSEEDRKKAQKGS